MIRYIQARVSVSDYTKIKVYAAKKNLTIDDLITKAVLRFIEVEDLLEDGFKDTEQVSGLTNQ